MIKATNAWERLSIDFKGPVKGPKPYLFVVIDEYSRFPFAFPCKKMTAEVVADCLSSLFNVFGFPTYIHSDRGTAFVSRELKYILSVRGTATSYSSPYHPEGNSQRERANQTMWKTVRLLLRSNDLAENQWELVLPTALHAIRNQTPHEATNQTPLERLFSYSHRATFGAAMPSWLLNNGTVLLCRFVRNKDEPFCDRVELLSANPTYARIKYPNGRESTVSTSDLAPYPPCGI